MSKNNSDSSDDNKGVLGSIVTQLKKLVGADNEGAIDDDEIRQSLGGQSATTSHRKPKKPESPKP